MANLIKTEKLHANIKHILIWCSWEARGPMKLFFVSCSLILSRTIGLMELRAPPIHLDEHQPARRCLAFENYLGRASWAAANLLQRLAVKTQNPWISCETGHQRPVDCSTQAAFSTSETAGNWVARPKTSSQPPTAAKCLSSIATTWWHSESS